MKKQTFILEVNDCQNQSWQGKLEWVQGRKNQSFRSVMELLRLIDSAVCENTETDIVDSFVQTEEQGEQI